MTCYTKVTLGKFEFYIKPSTLDPFMYSLPWYSRLHMSAVVKYDGYIVKSGMEPRTCPHSLDELLQLYVEEHKTHDEIIEENTGTLTLAGLMRGEKF